MRLRTAPGVWIRAARRTAGRRASAGRLDWPELKLPPINLHNAPPSPWMRRELEREGGEQA